MIYQQMTLSGDAEWPKVADAVIEALPLMSYGFSIVGKWIKSSSGPDALGEVEDIIRVVHSLDPDQSRQVLRVVSGQRVLQERINEVLVRAIASVCAHGVVEIVLPGDQVVHFGLRITESPRHVERLQPDVISVCERRRGRRNSADGSAPGEERRFSGEVAIFVDRRLCKKVDQRLSALLWHRIGVKAGSLCEGVGRADVAGKPLLRMPESHLLDLLRLRPGCGYDGTQQPLCGFLRVDELTKDSQGRDNCTRLQLGREVLDCAQCVRRLEQYLLEREERRYAVVGHPRQREYRHLPGSPEAAKGE